MSGLPPALIVGVSLLLFVGVFVGIFALVGRITARQIARLEPEGIERRSGSRRIKITLRDFRSPGRIASHRMSINYGELVLLREAVVVVTGVFMVRFANRDLDAAEVWVDGENLHFKSSKPQDASGSVEIRVPLPDAEAWREQLTARGARPRP